MSKLKFGFKKYYEPTPKNIQKIADTIQGCCLTALGYSAITSNKTITIIAVALLVLSKFFSEFFSEGRK